MQAEAMKPQQPRITEETFGFRQKIEVVPTAKRMAEIQAEAQAARDRGEEVPTNFSLTDDEKDIVVYDELIILRPSPLVDTVSQTIIRTGEHMRKKLTDVRAMADKFIANERNGHVNGGS
jgi:hypothetical protein